MIIKREQYVEALLNKRWNGKVKIITGIRRCGKSFLLSNLYKDYLKSEGIPEDCFIEIALDRKANMKYRNPNELYEYVVGKTQDESKRYYVFIDEIQLSYKVKNEDVDERLVPEEDMDLLYTTFYDILNDLMARSNLDIYVTGSNSKMLSTDIVTNFRDRGTEIKVYPLSFNEYYAYSGLEKADALEEYLMFGGMPLAVTENDEAEKRKYLKGLHKNVYVKDIVELTRVKDGKKQQSQYEIDFVVNTGQEKIYIQSALNVDSEEKKNQETFSLKNSGDLFRKIVIVDGNTKQWTDEDGIVYIGVIPFLLEESRLGF